MNKLLLLGLLGSCLCTAAQKPFFQNIKPTAFVLWDRLAMSQKDWADVKLSPSAPLTQNMDSLQAFDLKDGPVIGPLNGAGGRLAVQHEWVIGEKGRRKLVWSSGLGYHSFRRKSNTYAFYPFYPSRDTTKTYREETLSFELRQQYVDVYNSFAHEINLKTVPGFTLSIGVAVQLSLPLGSQIKETYWYTSLRWNTARRYWEALAPVEASLVSAARKPAVVSWSVPVGFDFRCSKKSSLRMDLEFFTSFRTPSLTATKRSSAAILLGLSFVHSLL